MSTIICPRCMTRNSVKATACRRCGTALDAAHGFAETVRASITPHELVGARWMVGRGLEDGEPVLIKTLGEERVRDRAARADFVRQANLLATLDHPNVARVLDIVEDAHAPAIVLEHIGGQRLSDVLAKTPRLPAAVALTIARQLLQALDHMHIRGVVHQHLSPRDVFVTTHLEDSEEGALRCVVANFGMAFVATEQSAGARDGRASSRSGTLVGMRPEESEQRVILSTYTAPETLEGSAEPSSDLYAVGAILYHALTGRPAIAVEAEPDGDTRHVVRAVRAEVPASLSEVRPESSAELSVLVDDLLHKLPGRRPSDARQVLLRMDETPEGRDPSMLFVPGGTFFRGSDPQRDPDARDEERPQRPIFVSGFHIARDPVTALEFKRFVDATAHPLPAEWSRHNDPSRHPERPVVFVNYDDAIAYAEWAGARLPTEAEWEKASRGPDGRVFPWGDAAPTEQDACFGGKKAPADIGQHLAGTSPYGARDMAGNVFEWVADWYASVAYASSPERDPTGPDVGNRRVMRGGSFVHPAFTLRCAVRGRYAPDERRANHSFRLAWSLAAPGS